VTEESRVWVITGLGFVPPTFAALGGIVVIVLMCGLGVVRVVVVVVIVDVRGYVAFGCYLAWWQPIGEFSVMCVFLMHTGIGTLLPQISVWISVQRLSGA
jgi:high-affinity K+ transport system ATPase subunit B